MGERRRGLLVDYGGVLTTNVFASFEQFCRAEGLAPDRVREAFLGDSRELLHELELGTIDEAEFERQFAERLGIRESAGLIDRLFGGMGPDEEMHDAVRRAREAGVRTGLVSNSWGTGLAYDPAQLSELFDAVVISGDVGLHKPQPEIYMLGAERAGVAPERCVFVDDLRENCSGAEAVGMAAVLHRGADTTIPELERLLGIGLS